ncbi:MULTISPECIES: LexA family transcriptional regulator [unclassified Sporosarcina]|uniref:LexA family protein n=1 Tax=unclassified Sporosarcina TaxID=2647733 RepID=UPI00203FE5C4|nr:MULTISPECIES: XRE family transcriptional regulator [unclassified Sporosarcina]GKV66735.1 LexA family transcriptional regulator [Sporosarcina sp. NCCP-2331]GLB57082.1 LexA family transcriptional regulator [Sporosarcina sp. NCCP-2378]
MKSQREILADNLESLIQSRGIDQKILAEKIGVSEMTASNWVRGIKYPRIDKIQALAEFFNVKHSDLVTDQTLISEGKPSNLIEVAPPTVRIPVLGKIACGDPILAEENIKGYRYESPDMLPSGTTFYLEATGDSMEPTIPNGSHVLIREQPEVEYGEIAAVLMNGNEDATLKRVRKQGDTVILMPDNPAHDPYIITEDNPARIIGKAIRFTQDL